MAKRNVRGKKIIMMAGGTGGHIFPALAVAHELTAQGAEIHWLGTRQGMEVELVAKAGFPLHTITMSGWKNKRLLATLILMLQTVWAIMQSLGLMWKIRPTMVIGLGGYVSLPGGIAAFLSRRCLVIHEQNVWPGLANRCLARLANQVLTAFPGVLSSVAGHKVSCVGNPMRPELRDLPSPTSRYLARKGPLNILVLGGSQGAAILNLVVPDALEILGKNERPCVWHQTGQAQYALTKKRYVKRALDDSKVTPFISDMAAAYAWADLVICRAGAMTMSELMCVGVASLLVPYAQAADDHQSKNAQYLVAADAALLMRETSLNAKQLAAWLQCYSQKRKALLAIAEKAYLLRTPDNLFLSSLLQS